MTNDSIASFILLEIVSNINILIIQPLFINFTWVSDAPQGLFLSLLLLFLHVNGLSEGIDADMVYGYTNDSL